MKKLDRYFFFLLALCAVVTVDVSAQSRRKLLKSAEAGDAEAQCKLAECYMWGQKSYFGTSFEVASDYDEAEWWLLESARQGYADAYSDLGILYSIFIFDKQRAIYWNKAAADWDEYGSENALQRLEALGEPDYAVFGSDARRRAQGTVAAGYHGRDEEELLDAARRGDGAACFGLGLMYGAFGEKHDKQKAIEWYTRAADTAADEAVVKQAVRNLEKLGVLHIPAGYPPQPGAYAASDTRLRDMDDAQRSLLLELAEEGNARAQYYLGVCYYSGMLSYNGENHEAACDYDEAERWLLAAARQGHTSAYSILGSLYSSSTGMRNEQEAIKWYKKAVYAGQSYVAEDLARLGVTWDPVTRSVRSAVPLDLHASEEEMEAATRADLLPLAEAGNAWAQYYLGECYRSGKLSYDNSDGWWMRRDRGAAERWLLKAAERGYFQAYISLGIFYEEVDKAKAISWYKRWVDYFYCYTGDADSESVTVARNFLKILFDISYDPRTGGEEVEDADAYMSFDQMNKASRAALLPLAEAGDPWAQYFLGVCYANGWASYDGDGSKTDVDYPEAERLLLESARRENASACYFLWQFYFYIKGDRQQALRWLKRVADFYYYNDGGKIPEEVAQGFSTLGITYDPAGE